MEIFHGQKCDLGRDSSSSHLKLTLPCLPGLEKSSFLSSWTASNSAVIQLINWSPERSSGSFSSFLVVLGAENIRASMLRSLGRSQACSRMSRRGS